MLNKRSLRQYLPLILATLALFTACEDKSGTLGLDVLPSDDLFSGKDSVSFLNSSNYNPGRLKSNDASFAIIGSLNDPFTGITDASFITEVTLADRIGKLNKTSQVREYFVDSLILNLTYKKGWWIGNPEAIHEVSIHRFNNPLSLTETYFSDMPVEGLYDETPLASVLKSANEGREDSTWTDNDNTNQWKFKLDDALANEVFNFHDSIMTNRQYFKEAFGGLFIKSKLADTDTKGSLVEFSLLDPLSNMKMHYGYYVIDTVTNAKTDTVFTSYTFPINIECVRINRFSHDHQEEIAFDEPETEHLIVQGMAGSMVKIDFNDVEVIDDDGQEVNLFTYWEEKIETAENNEYYGISAVTISFEADTIAQYADENFHSPVAEALRLYVKTADGQFELPKYSYSASDDSKWSPEFSEGGYNEETNSYQFSMAGESFKMMIEKPELRGPYYLSTPNPVSYPWKAILKNSDNPDALSPAIRLKYVKIQNP